MIMNYCFLYNDATNLYFFLCFGILEVKHLPKVLFFGKGGSGKSTITSLLAYSFVRKNFRTLVIDSDESNTTLYRMLGLESPSKTLVDLMGGRKKVSNFLFRGEGELDWKLPDSFGFNDLPKECVAWKGNLGLLVIGKVGEYGSGCACPFNALAREFLKRLELNDKEIVLIDTDAGIEHFGRAVEEACDLLILTVDPTYESIVLAEKAEKLAHQVNKKLYMILNKVDGETERILREKLRGKNVLGSINYDAEIAKKALIGESMEDIRLDNVEKITGELIALINSRG